MKQFHVMSDRKTVKEMQKKDYLKAVGRPNWLLGWVDETDICFVKNNDVIYLSLEQLHQILQLNQKEV